MKGSSLLLRPRERSAFWVRTAPADHDFLYITGLVKADSEDRLDGSTHRAADSYHRARAARFLRRGSIFRGLNVEKTSAPCSSW